mmetsp:Transcript_30655/g.78288  ORF Transcript_30655/g.78288 Transcript_30655/m.78288 type:complete len:217 (-) Transcript_30655:149-799(-)
MCHTTICISWRAWWGSTGSTTEDCSAHTEGQPPGWQPATRLMQCTSRSYTRHLAVVSPLTGSLNSSTPRMVSCCTVSSAAWLAPPPSCVLRACSMAALPAASASAAPRLLPLCAGLPGSDEGDRLLVWLMLSTASTLVGCPADATGGQTQLNSASAVQKTPPRTALCRMQSCSLAPGLMASSISSIEQQLGWRPWASTSSPKARGFIRGRTSIQLL